MDWPLITSILAMFLLLLIMSQRWWAETRSGFLVALCLSLLVLTKPISMAAKAPSVFVLDTLIFLLFYSALLYFVTHKYFTKENLLQPPSLSMLVATLEGRKKHRIAKLVRIGIPILFFGLLGVAALCVQLFGRP